MGHIQSHPGESSGFAPRGGSWAEYAGYEGLRSVLDPADAAGHKNAGIDRLHRAALARALPRGPRVARGLDLGCGTGRLCPFLAARVGHLAAVDATPAMLRRARHESRVANVGFARSDGVALPFRDACLDLVVSVYVLQYAVADAALYGRMLSGTYKIPNIYCSVKDDSEK